MSIPSQTRSFFSPSARSQNKTASNNINDPPRKGEASTKQEDPSIAETSSENSESSRQTREGEKTKREKTNEQKEEEKKEEKKTPPPPPPPHGDKTPWQVFRETLQNEFKASKEWNESTKALASSAHQFTENESVKRARAAYTAASGAATSTTSSALRSTGRTLGKGAAWTWETPIVKGVRAGVNATGKGIDKVTKPVRETAAFKSVKEVIDDGSSSRYGGWVEKEERRKRRELQELKMGKREKIEEDPKWVFL